MTVACIACSLFLCAHHDHNIHEKALAIAGTGSLHQPPNLTQRSTNINVESLRIECKVSHSINIVICYVL